jgi:uncharacterized protein (DUF305 family)
MDKQMDQEIEKLEARDKELEGLISECDGRLDEQSAEIQSLNQWRKGNGAKGAEDRLQSVEEGMKEIRVGITDGDISKIALAASSLIVGTARDRDRTFVMKLKAVGPIVAAICALVVVIIQALKG